MDMDVAGYAECVFDSDKVADNVANCLDCGKSYSCVAALNKHRRNKHGETGKNSVQKITCPIKECILQFCGHSEIREHLQTFHDVNTSSEKFVFDSDKVADNMAKCLDCGKSFSRVSALNKHRRNKHGETRKKPLPKLQCPIEECIQHFCTYSILREHLQTFHDLSISCEKFVFNSDEEFDFWLHSIQNELSCQYLIRTSLYQDDGCKRIKLQCSRSYQYKSKRKGDVKRKIKSMGTKKIGKVCPSTIEVLKTTGTSVKIYVEFWKDHVGHNCELEHITIPKRDRDEIARKLKNGLTFERILEDIQKPVDPDFSWSKRSRLIKRIDLHNIVRQYNISSTITSTTSQALNKEPQKDQSQSNVHATSENSEVESLFTIVKSKEHAVPAREKINKWLKIVNVLFESASDNIVEENFDIVVKNLMTAADKLTGGANSMNIKEKVNLNEKIDKQVSKKRKSKPASVYKKPIHNERENMVEYLKNPTEESMNIHEEFDHSYFNRST